MPNSFFLNAVLIAVCWGLWPSLMKFSTATPTMKSFLFAGVTFAGIIGPFLMDGRGVYAGATRMGLLIIAVCGAMNSFGTLRYNFLLEVIPRHMISTFVTAILVGMILVAVTAGVVIHKEPITRPKLVFWTLAVLTLVAAGYAGLEDARIVNEKRSAAAALELTVTE